MMSRCNAAVTDGKPMLPPYGMEPVYCIMNGLSLMRRSGQFRGPPEFQLVLLSTMLQAKVLLG